MEVRHNWRDINQKKKKKPDESDPIVLCGVDRWRAVLFCSVGVYPDNLVAHPWGADTCKREGIEY